MEIEEGIIEKISRRKAWVRIQRRAACSTCSSHDTCDIVSNKGKVTIEVVNHLKAKIGDHVEISMPEGSLLKLSFLVYFLPVVALILGAVLGEKWAEYAQTDSALFSIGGGAVAMSMVFCLLKWFERGSKTKDKYYPRMTRIIYSPSHNESGERGPLPDHG